MQTLEHHMRYLRRTAVAVGVTAGLTLLAVAAGFLVAGTGLAKPSRATTGAELPRHRVNSTYHPPAGPVIALNAGDNLQQALNAARPGSIITLQAGATFAGPLVIPKKASGEWIVIRSAVPDAKLPAPGSRVHSRDAALMPKIVSPGPGVPAVQTEPGAHHVRFIAVEFKKADSQAGADSLIQFGDSARTQREPGQVPHHLILDRVYVHGEAVSGVKHCVILNSAETAVVDSYIAECKIVGYDSQAIVGWNGPGPFKIVNNYLEGAGENLLFGGADSASAELAPADIEVRNNHITKPLTWKIDDPVYAGTPWTIKNLLELKSARRVLIDGNVLEHSWPHGQSGFAILLTPRNQDGAAPWSAVEDVTFTNNIVRHSAHGLDILGQDNHFPSQKARRIVIRNNLFEDVGPVGWGGQGRLFQIRDGAEQVVIEHNTAFHTGSLIIADGAPNRGLVFENNITQVNLYGITGNGKGVGVPSLEAHFLGYRFENNVIAGPWPSPGDAATSMFPPKNFYPMTLDDVGFVDRAKGDYRLAVTSEYRRAGTTGKDVGADLQAIASATAKVVSNGTKRG